MNGPLRVTTLIMVLFASAPAGADDSAEAGKHFTAGQAAEASHQWRVAIEEYEQAYALAPHPSVLFNMAHAHEQLEEYRRAAELLRSYLAESPAAEDRGVVERRISDLQARPSRVRVAMPPGATLFVDDVPRPTPPFEIEVAGGAHSARATLGTDSSDLTTFTLEYGEPHDLTLAIRSSNTFDDAPVGIAFVFGVGTHPSLGDAWDSGTPVSLAGRLRVGYRLASRLRVFGELGGMVGPSIEDDRVGIELGPKESFLLFTPRAGATLTLLRKSGALRVDAFAVVGAVIGYHSLAFDVDTVARQSVSGVGGGAGLEIVYASRTAPRQQWLVSAGWFTMPSDVGSNTGFRSTGTVDLGGLEIVVGWAVAVGGPQ